MRIGSHKTDHPQALLVLAVMLVATAALPGIAQQPVGLQPPRTTADAPPQPLPLQAAAPNSPNVIYIVLDDLGFADLGSFGSEIATPSIDAVAGQGLRFTNFHTRSICSPTRASLLTGRNSHAVGMKDLAGNDTGYANARGRITPAAATVAQMLRTAGYSTYALGKWHLTPHSEMAITCPRTSSTARSGWFATAASQTAPSHSFSTWRLAPRIRPYRFQTRTSESIAAGTIKAGISYGRTGSRGKRSLV